MMTIKLDIPPLVLIATPYHTWSCQSSAALTLLHPFLVMFKYLVKNSGIVCLIHQISRLVFTNIKQAFLALYPATWVDIERLIWNSRQRRDKVHVRQGGESSMSSHAVRMLSVICRWISLEPPRTLSDVEKLRILYNHEVVSLAITTSK